MITDISSRHSMLTWHWLPVSVMSKADTIAQPHRAYSFVHSVPDQTRPPSCRPKLIHPSAFSAVGLRPRRPLFVHVCRRREDKHDQRNDWRGSKQARAEQRRIIKVHYSFSCTTVQRHSPPYTLDYIYCGADSLGGKNVTELNWRNKRTTYRQGNVFCG